MNCRWRDIPGTLDERGWRVVKCVRCGYDFKGNPTPHPFHKIYHDCTAMPLHDEPHLWAAVFWEAGTSEAVAICQYIRWRFRGSKLSELPPGIPPPRLPPKNGGLSDEEIKAILPDESDPTLIGNRLKAAFEAIGFPPCPGCDARAEYMNRLHQWFRTLAPGERMG